MIHRSRPKLAASAIGRDTPVGTAHRLLGRKSGDGLSPPGALVRTFTDGLP
jgi:hypothetical protein